MLPELASGFTRAYTRLILRSPSLTVLVLVLVTLLLLKPALTFEQNMTRDIEVYLPEGEESTDLLLEVRKDWATDIIIIYIETRNANDPERFNDRVIHNITYVPTLKEIARLEQLIDPEGQSMDQATHPADRGIQDDIIFTLSISTLIKEFNSTDARFIEAIEGKVFGGLSVEQRDDELVNETGRYAIPSDQDRVDQIYTQTSGALQNFALSLGAGLFEEIIFRVILLNLLFLFLKPLLKNKVTTAVISVLAASFLFSLSHYVGSMADSWELYSFMFRWIAGLLFTVLYFMRGFAITAYTHALYDIWVLV